METLNGNNLLSYPTNAHFHSVSTSFTPIQKLTRYNDYYFYINKHKLSQTPTDELTKIRFTGMQTQNNVSIYCNFQFAVLPLTASDFTKEIYDVRFYNKIIKEQQIKINKLETELSSIKLSFDPAYYYGPLAHNNIHIAMFKQTSQVKFSGTDFQFVPPNYQRLRFKKAGIYNICYIDGVRTNGSSYLKIKFFNTGLDISNKNDYIRFPIENTLSTWIKICESLTVPVKKDAELQIELTRDILDGTNNSRIMINKVAGFPVNII